MSPKEKATQLLKMGKDSAKIVTNNMVKELEGLFIEILGEGRQSCQYTRKRLDFWIEVETLVS